MDLLHHVYWQKLLLWDRFLYFRFFFVACTPSVSNISPQSVPWSYTDDTLYLEQGSPPSGAWICHRMSIYLLLTPNSVVPGSFLHVSAPCLFVLTIDVHSVDTGSPKPCWPEHRLFFSNLWSLQRFNNWSQWHILPIHQCCPLSHHHLLNNAVIGIID